MPTKVTTRSGGPMKIKEGLLKGGISGSYGGFNLGDEAILAGMIAKLRASLRVELTVFSRNPDDTLERHHVERSVPIRQLTRREAREAVQRLDLLILGGGGILYDADAESPRSGVSSGTGHPGRGIRRQRRPA